MIKHIKYASREEWLKIRQNYIGGSEAGAVVGLNPYESAYHLWSVKTGQIPAFEGNLTTEVGAYLEEFVAKQFEEATGKKVKRHNATMVNEDYPFACANVDRLVVGEKALLEIKTTNSIPAMKQIRGNEFPEQWYCQMTHYLAVSGLDRAYLCVLVNCREIKTFTLERDEAEIAALMDAERSFWNCVCSMTPPAVVGASDEAETITALYPVASDETVSLDAYQNELRRWSALNAQIKELKQMQDEVANSIRAFMGEAAKGATDGFKVSWANASKRTFDEKAYIADHPNEDFSKYYKESSYRTFKITESKK